MQCGTLVIPDRQKKKTPDRPGFSFSLLFFTSWSLKATVRQLLQYHCWLLPPLYNHWPTVEPDDVP